jgi:hypothetical protein
MIIDRDHPLMLDTHVFDEDGKEHYFSYIDIKDRPDKRSGYIESGEEGIYGKDNDVRNLTWKHWGHNELCPYDYFIKGEKNILTGKIQHIINEQFHLTDPKVMEERAGSDKLDFSKLRKAQEELDKDKDKDKTTYFIRDNPGSDTGTLVGPPMNIEEFKERMKEVSKSVSKVDDKRNE